MRCYVEHVRERIENLKTFWESDGNVLGTWWEHIRNRKKKKKKKTNPLSPKTQKRKLITPNKSSHWLHEVSYLQSGLLPFKTGTNTPL